MARVLFAVAAMVALGPLHASRCMAAPVVGIAGWEGDGFRQGYGFIAGRTAFAESARFSIPVQIAGSYLYYNYRDQGSEVAVRAPGAAGLIGFGSVGSWGSASVLTGGEVRWERREREFAAGPGASVARGGVIAQGQADLALSRRLRPSLLVNYAGAARYIYGRTVLKWQCSNLDWSNATTWFVGIEGVGQGNSDTDAIQAGGTVECTFVRSRLSVGIRSGYKDSSSEGGRRQGGYVGASFYRRF